MRFVAMTKKGILGIFQLNSFMFHALTTIQTFLFIEAKSFLKKVGPGLQIFLNFLGILLKPKKH